MPRRDEPNRQHDNATALVAEVERALAVKSQAPVPTEEKSSLHDEIKEKLREIGQLQNYLSETECKLNGERLDVAWRRVAASVPQKVFEVQVSGNLYAAVAKLLQILGMSGNVLVAILLPCGSWFKPKLKACSQACQTSLLQNLFHSRSFSIALTGSRPFRPDSVAGPSPQVVGN